MKKRLLPLLLLLATAAPLLWAALAPVSAASRDQLFEIPKGTWERRMAGKKDEILPERITLTLGVRDVLHLRNSDTVPQIFGPVLIMPGQDFRLPFEQTGEHPFACTAHASGQMTVVVEEAPAPGWARLRWRFQTLLNHFA
ncbi:cupredoxin domain-containing protein [Massilia sp. SM-13]|uniref:cupredoxin domain-containing protein n=1 Tax=Pseudoduganella rhizocola TaxID=3382643 RepID=UPI0038B4760E